jgi:hypothetical protein
MGMMMMGISRCLSGCLMSNVIYDDGSGCMSVRHCEYSKSCDERTWSARNPVTITAKELPKKVIK